MLTKKPCKKYLPAHALAITNAQKTNITSQNMGSTFCGISAIVPKAIINPKSDN
jgi:hypothetical protein